MVEPYLFRASLFPCLWMGRDETKYITKGIENNAVVSTYYCKDGANIEKPGNQGN